MLSFTDETTTNLFTHFHHIFNPPRPRAAVATREHPAAAPGHSARVPASLRRRRRRRGVAVPPSHTAVGAVAVDAVQRNCGGDGLPLTLGHLLSLVDVQDRRLPPRDAVVLKVARCQAEKLGVVLHDEMRVGAWGLLQRSKRGGRRKPKRERKKAGIVCCCPAERLQTVLFQACGWLATKSWTNQYQRRRKRTGLFSAFRRDRRRGVHTRMGVCSCIIQPKKGREKKAGITTKISLALRRS